MLGSTDFWIVTKDEIKQRFASDGPGFEDFIVALLYLYADEVGISYSKINANSGTSESDESVDALVKAPNPSSYVIVCSTPNGVKDASARIAEWFTVPTI